KPIASNGAPKNADLVGPAANASAPAPTIPSPNKTSPAPAKDMPASIPEFPLAAVATPSGGQSAQNGPASLAPRSNAAGPNNTGIQSSQPKTGGGSKPAETTASPLLADSRPSGAGTPSASGQPSNPAPNAPASKSDGSGLLAGVNNPGVRATPT